MVPMFVLHSIAVSFIKSYSFRSYKLIKVETHSHQSLPHQEYCPPPAVCCLVTKHIKGRKIVRFDGVHTVLSSARFVNFTTISVSCKRKEIMKIAIWSEFVPENFFHLRRARRRSLWRGKTSHKYGDTNLLLCSIHMQFRFPLRVIRAFLRLLIYHMTK